MVTDFGALKTASEYVAFLLEAGVLPVEIAETLEHALDQQRAAYIANPHWQTCLYRDQAAALVASVRRSGQKKAPAVREALRLFKEALRSRELPVDEDSPSYVPLAALIILSRIRKKKCAMSEKQWLRFYRDGQKTQ